MNDSSDLMMSKARFIINPLFTLCCYLAFLLHAQPTNVKAGETDIENPHAKINTERAFVESSESSGDIL